MRLYAFVPATLIESDNLGGWEGCRAGPFRRKTYILTMTTQDMLTIAVLLTVVLVALLFPGGPGTGKRFRLPIPKRAEYWSV